MLSNSVRPLYSKYLHFFIGERKMSFLLHKPASPRADPYAELKAFKPGNIFSSQTALLLKYLQSLQVNSISILISCHSFIYPIITKYYYREDKSKNSIYCYTNSKCPERFFASCCEFSESCCEPDA